METFELRYFLGVAAVENIHRASKKLNVSPGSLSKAITRLEDELLVKLFQKDGRNIKLTSAGRVLQLRASEIIRLEEATKLELTGTEGTIHVVIAGPEVLLAMEGGDLIQSLKKKIPKATFEFIAVEEDEAMALIQRGEAHLAIVTKDFPREKSVKEKILRETLFQTFMGKKHLLAEKLKARKSISIEEVLEHPFVSPSRALLGQVGLKQSLDGWRDDRFPRKIEYITSSLKVLEKLVEEGKALAHMPQELGESLDFVQLKITGCSYVCNQKIRLLSRNPKDLAWLENLF